MTNTAIKQAIISLLGDFGAFSRKVIRVPLYQYQMQVTEPIIQSILSNRGDEYLLIFPRQSGKNEVTAQLLVYFLLLFQKKGGNIVFAATGDGAGRGARRLDDRPRTVATQPVGQHHIDGLRRGRRQVGDLGAHLGALLP